MPDTSGWTPQEWINLLLASAAVLCGAVNQFQRVALAALKRRFDANGDNP